MPRPQGASPCGRFVSGSRRPGRKVRRSPRNGTVPRVLALAVMLAAVPSGPARAERTGPGASEKLRRDAVVRAVESSRPAVVNVNAEAGSIRSNPFSGFGDPFFDRFFNDFFEAPSRRSAPSQSLGSGVIIDPAGFVLTNEHVVARAARIRVTLADERSFDARVVGADPDHDLAVLKIDAAGDLPSLEIGTSSEILIGEKVIAIGNPFGLSHTVTTGVVSATRRSIRTSRGRIYYDFIQTDAAINPGNSGGPLLDVAGRMIGINTAIYAEGSGIGFAIPADVARRVVDDLVRYGEVHPVWLGVAVGDLKKDREGGGEDRSGVAVTGLLEGSAGDAAGLRPGDIIATVGDETVRSAGEFHFRVGTYSEGDLVPLKVRRGRKEVEFIVRAEVPGEKEARRILWEWFGIEVGRERMGLEITRIRRGSTAARVGLQRGDRILEVEGERVEGEEFSERILGAGQKGLLLLLVQRGRWGYRVTLTVAQRP